jgi:hypothetical protein
MNIQIYLPLFFASVFNTPDRPRRAFNDCLSYCYVHMAMLRECQKQRIKLPIFTQILYQCGEQKD